MNSESDLFEFYLLYFKEVAGLNLDDKTTIPFGDPENKTRKINSYLNGGSMLFTHKL